jgi:ABC-type polysaccharide/polyol phosphate export permease
VLFQVLFVRFAISSLLPALLLISFVVIPFYAHAMGDQQPREYLSRNPVLHRIDEIREPGISRSSGMG